MLGDKLTWIHSELVLHVEVRQDSADTDHFEEMAQEARPLAVLMHI